MKKSDIKEVLRCAVKPRSLCRVFLKYDHNYRYYFPLAVSDRLFLAASEDDFILDGFTVRRFRDVKKVEKESISNDECEFAIGRIAKVSKTKILFKNFDADGIWQDGCYEIPYSEITSVTFLSRYVEVFSKYV